MIGDHLQVTIGRAADYAREAGHEYVTLEHLLLALTHDPEAREALLALGTDVERLRGDLEAVLAEYESVPGSESDFTLGVHRVVQGAVLQLHASGKGHQTADGARVLVELLEEEDSPARAALEAQGVTRLDVLGYVSHGTAKVAGRERERHTPGTEGEPGAEGTETAQNPLEAYATDLTAGARAGEFDPVIGREVELERVVHILARRVKNNPVLVGEPGVGKTALAEGLAQRVADGEAPGFLKGASVYALDLGALLAGTRYRGDFEQRLKAVLAALDGQNAVLFIDELHTLVGAGATEGAAWTRRTCSSPPWPGDGCGCWGRRRPPRCVTWRRTAPCGAASRPSRCPSRPRRTLSPSCKASHPGTPPTTGSRTPMGRSTPPCASLPGTCATAFCPTRPST